MKELLISILIGIQSLLGIGGEPAQTEPQTLGATVFNSKQVGTNPVTGYYLQTDGTNSSWQPVVGGGGSGGGTWATTTSTHANRLINYPLNTTDIVVIGGTSTTTGATEYWFDPNTQNAHIGSSLTASTTIMGNATTTGGFNTSLLGVGTDWISDLTGSGLSIVGGALTASGGSGNVSTSTNETAGRLAYWTTTNGTPASLADVATTTLTASAPLSLSQPVVKVGGSNSTLSLDTSGAWSGTAGSLAANGANCSSGNAPLGVDASGAVESCFDVWTEAENTSAGYARFPFTVNTGYNSTSTALAFLNGFFSIASSTISGDFRLPALSQGFAYIGSTGKVNSIASSSINLSWFNNDAGFTTFAWPFTPQTWGVSTSTTLGMLNGFLSTASSTIVGNATTTGGQYLGRLYGANLSACNSTTQKLLWTADGQFTCGTDAGAGGGMTSFVAGEGLLGGTITDGGTVYAQVGTSSIPTVGNLSYWTGVGSASSPAKLGTVATTSVSCSGSVSCTGFNVLGSSPITITGTDNTASSTLLSDTNYFSAVNRFNFASTTYHSFGTASTTNLTFGGVTGNKWTDFCVSITGSADLCDGSDASGAGGSSAYEIATTSTITVPQVAYFTQTAGRTTLGSIATGTISVPTGLTVTANRYALGGATAIALDTGYVIPLQTTLDAKLVSLGSGYATTTQNTIAFSTSTTAFQGLTFGQTIIPTAGALTFAPTITGTLGNAGLTNSSITLNGSSVSLGGSLTVSSTTLLGDTNSWTGVNRFGNASSTYHSFTTASTTNLNIGGDSFFDLTGTGLSITSNSLGLNLGNANTWTAKQNFYGAASSTLLSANWLKVGQNASTTIDVDGSVEIATSTPWLRSMLNVVGTTTITGNFANLRASTTANTTQTINWANGNYQDIMLTGNTSIVMNSTSSNPLDGGFYKLRICQDPTGSRTLTWANPISLRWGGKGTTTISSTANTCTFILFNYTATNGTTIYTGIASTTGAPIR